MPEKNIADTIQAILEKNKGFMVATKLAALMSEDMKNVLGIKKGETGKIIQRKIEKYAEGRFIFRNKGKGVYILVPCEPSEFVMSLLPENKAFDTKIIRILPFTKSVFYAVINELTDEGRVLTKYDEKGRPRIYRAAKMMKVSAGEKDSGEYTPERFREAFEKSDRGRTFVRIFKIRRWLGWPREVFDNMVMTLLKEGKIFVHPAEPTVLKPDEYEDSFRDEFGDMNGTVTWND